jgi:hypothetical protein
MDRPSRPGMAAASGGKGGFPDDDSDGAKGGQGSAAEKGQTWRSQMRARTMAGMHSCYLESQTLIAFIRRLNKNMCY